MNNTLEKILNRYFYPLFGNIKNLFLRVMYKKNSSKKSFDWKWDEINYNRIALVNLILSKFNSPSYLEIGCAKNSLFNSVPVKNKIGVDPKEGGNIRKSSDDFFKQNKSSFDVIFIDGLHTYEQVRRDIINAIKILNKSGFIIIHDMLPLDWKENHYPILTRNAWTGDVWKVALELISTKGIDFKIVKIDHGVGVVRLTKSDVTLNNISDYLHNKNFNFYYANIRKFPIITWDRFIKWL